MRVWDRYHERLIYPYKCLSCSREFDVTKPIRDIDLPEACPACKSGTTERFIAQTHFYGASDWDKAEYNPALGCVVRNRFHRAEIAKRKGLEEIGNEPVEKMHAHYEQRKREQIEESWAKV